MKDFLRRAAAPAGFLLVLLVQVLLKDHRRHPAASHPYFAWFAGGLLVLTLAAFVLSFFVTRVKAFLEKSGPLLFLVSAVLALLNVLTAKTAVLPALLFPSFDNVLSVFVESRSLMLKCVLHSVKLLSAGIFWGVLIGFTAGVLLGYFRRVNYWLNPFLKAIGPIPATAWIPFSLVVFPTTFGASVYNRPCSVVSGSFTYKLRNPEYPEFIF